MRARVVQVASAVVGVVALANQFYLAHALFDERLTPPVVVAFAEVSVLVGVAYGRLREADQRARDVRYERTRAEIFGPRTTPAPWMRWL